MKITHVTTRVLRTPADNPLVVGLPAPNDTREFVTLELGTDQGLVGIGLTFFGGALTPALKAAVDALAAAHHRRRSHPGRGDRRQAAGAPPAARAPAASSRWRSPPSTSRAGTSRARPLGQSVCALLGGLRDRAPTYASGALMRPHPIDYLAKAGPRLRDMGFRQMKMQCGERAHGRAPRSSACA